MSKPSTRSLPCLGLFPVLVMTLMASSPTAQIAFGPVHPIPPAVDALANPVVLADIDGDGDPDVLQPHILSSVFGYARNQGGKYPQMTTIPALPLPGVIQPADVNGDGLVDLAAANVPGLLVILGQGHGRFGPVITSPSSQIPLTLALDDFDGDHLPDALLFGGSPLALTGQIIFRHGLGDGSFGPEQIVIPSGNGASTVAATGDIDGNGLSDAVITTGLLGSGTKIFSVLSRGGGAFEVLEHVLASSPKALKLADLDGDGAAELIQSGGGSLCVLRGLGDGTFGPAQTLLTNATGSVAVADFDQDGRPDLAYLSGSPGVVTFFRQLLPFRFEPVGTSFGWTAGTVLAVADVDSDGSPDLVASGNLAGFSWARNRGVH